MSEKVEIMVFKCVSCDYLELYPYHCGRPMELQEERLVCWRGEHKPCCNSSSVLPLPQHHGETMKIHHALAELLPNKQVLIHEVLEN